MTTEENQIVPTSVPPPVCRILHSPTSDSNPDLLDDDSIPATNLLQVNATATRCLSSVFLLSRGPSPTPNNNRMSNGGNLWFEEESEIIRNCAVLSAAVGLQKSFSTSDILGAAEEQLFPSRSIVSEPALNSLQRSGFLLETARLDHTSRSCSTWVAVGDIVPASQLPSPHNQHSYITTNNNNGASLGAAQQPVFTAADFVRSVNKKVRNNYIRRRLLSTYKALERLQEPDLNHGFNENTSSPCFQGSTKRLLTVPGAALLSTLPMSASAITLNTVNNNDGKSVIPVTVTGAGKLLPLTITDIRRECGRPLSKYERNMMIFNWLHTLDNSSSSLAGYQADGVL